MAFDTRELTVKINGDTRGLERALGEASSGSSKFGHALGAAFKTAAVATAAAGAAFTAMGVLSVKAFSESEDAIAQTNAVLKSTGGIAGVTADQVSELASALQKTTKFSDEEVRSAENLLLTFTSIGKDIFPEATKTVLDMSTALGQDLKSSSVQLGKALQDPITGITALRRVGVNFSDSQQEVIKNLVETGRKAEAQKLILKELQTEFGGSAVAAGKTFSGSLTILRNQLGEVQETIGKVIVTGLTPFVTKAAEAVNAINWDAVISRTNSALNEFFGKIAAIYTQLATYLEPKLRAIWNTIQNDFGPAVLGLVRAFGPQVGAGLAWAIGTAIDMANAALQFFTPLINFLKDNTWVIWGVVGAFVALKTALAIDAAVKGFMGALALMNGAALTSTGIIGGLRLALLALTNPWVIGISIVGAAAVLATIASLQGAFDKLRGAVDDLKSKKIDVGAGATVSGGSGIGMVEQLKRSFGFRASGGPVSGGSPYIVGETGRELFIPNQSGSIVNAQQTKQLLNNGSSSGSGINIQVNMGMYAGMPVEKRQIALDLYRELVRAARAQGVQLPMIGAMSPQ